MGDGDNVWPSEYMLLMGYYPDRFAMHGLPVDTFVTIVETGAYSGTPEALLRDAADMLVTACVEKYRLNWGTNRGFAPFDFQDTFWSVQLRPTNESDTDG